MKIDMDTFSDKLQEECAVFGVCVTSEEAAGLTYNGLLALQHRGQESAGIAVASGGGIVCRKDVGLASEVFSGVFDVSRPKCGHSGGQGQCTARVSADTMAGKIAVGHTRYSTTGGNVKDNAGPFVTEYLTGRIATAHNGNLSNANEIRCKLQAQGVNFTSSSDSEVVSSLIALYISQEGSLLKGALKAAEMLRGAFSLAIASSENKLLALRDTKGFRPLCIGKSNYGYAVASESCALEACGFEFVRDVEPGEVIIIEDGKIVSQGVKLTPRADEYGGLCIFEYVYFARPDSVVDGLNVYRARHNMGAILAEEYPVEADIVCGVPDSGLDAASGYSAYSGLPLVSVFVKNRYIGRSFIYPTQTQRDSAVRLKLNPLSENIRGKRIVLVDDSIVRGTTSEKIVRSLKNAGAKEVHMRVSSPPFRHTCHYGTDIDSEENLIANKLSLEEIRQKIGADSLGFISIDGLRRACHKSKLTFCTACFTGNGDATRDKKDIFE